MDPIKLPDTTIVVKDEKEYVTVTKLFLFSTVIIIFFMILFYMQTQKKQVILDEKDFSWDINDFIPIEEQHPDYIMSQINEEELIKSL